MSNSADTFTVLAANFKEVYGDLHNLIPDTAKLMKMIPFKPKAKIGYCSLPILVSSIFSV